MQERKGFVWVSTSEAQANRIAAGFPLASTQVRARPGRLHRGQWWEPRWVVLLHGLTPEQERWLRQRLEAETRASGSIDRGDGGAG